MCERQSSPLRLCGGCFPSPPKKIRINIAKLKLLKSYFSTWCTVEHLTQTDISDHPLPGHCKEMMLSLAKIWCPKYDRDSINRKWIPFLFSVFVCKGGWRHTHTDTRVPKSSFRVLHELKACRPHICYNMDGCAGCAPERNIMLHRCSTFIWSV